MNCFPGQSHFHGILEFGKATFFYISSYPPVFPPKPETNSELKHQKMDAWNTRTFPFGMAYFQGQTVTFREGSFLLCFSFFILISKSCDFCSQKITHPEHNNSRADPDLIARTQ